MGDSRLRGVRHFKYKTNVVGSKALYVVRMSFICIACLLDKLINIKRNLIDYITLFTALNKKKTFSTKRQTFLPFRNQVLICNQQELFSARLKLFAFLTAFLTALEDHI